MGPKIAIIGGGIGRLTAAVALARRGLAAEVYEQAPALEEVGAGVGLWPNAMAAFEPIGLSGKVAQLAVTIGRQGIKRPDGTWLMYIPEGVMARRWGSGFVLVHRAELQQLLAAELDPAVIHLGTCCTGFEDSGQAVIARFADGREVQADVLVGADGVHSVVRAKLFGPASLRYRGYTAVRSLTPAGSVPLPRDGTETWGPGRALRPGADHRRPDHLVRNVECHGGRDGRRRHRSALAQALRGLARSHTRHHRSDPKAALIRNDISDRWPTRTWGRGRVALLGDAIHPMTPDLAQGACQAIVDATALATCLAASRDTGAALREYQQRRWRNAATTTLIARNTGAMGQWKGRLTCAARDAMMQATPLSLQLRQFDVVLRPRQVGGQRRTS